MNCALQFNFRNRRFSVVVAGLFFLALAARADNPNSIIYSKHNLSISSPGTVHASTEWDVCIFCHTPHGASASEGPLWNHQMSTATYTPYSSATLKAVVGQPNGSSRLCLSCHDGTVALGLVGSRAGGIAMNATTIPVGVNNLGTDLSSDHPVSFTYDSALAVADGNLSDPKTLPPEIVLDENSQLQCTACHDPHNNQYGNFLVMDNTGSALCLACHTISTWNGSGHQLSTKQLPVSLAAQIAPATSAQGKSAVAVDSVAHAACASCHATHAAGTGLELMRFSAPEKNCIDCHAGEGPGKDVASDLNKISAHASLTSPDAHNAREDLVNPPIRHVTCADCHNPHATSNAPGGVNQVSGALASVAGVGAGGGILPAVTHEYELCFRCHGDSANRGPSRVPRQFEQTNTRLEFSPGNISFHPVESIGKNPNVPSLISPLTPASLTGCGDCHNSDQSPAAGGSGANGPHGSAFVPLIERNLLLSDGTPYNAANFALCYKCHSSLVVDSELGSSWPNHRTHIENYRAVCTTCHDSHAATQPHLINFNTAYVSPNNGVLNYVSTGPNHGTCTLTCHDGNGQSMTHTATSY